jgi:hypothetical protein
VLLVFGAPCQHSLLAGREHGRTIPSAIIVAIDQYAEAATGNCDFFLNKPPNVVSRQRATSLKLV